MSEQTWRDVAATRQALIEQLKAEKGRLAREVEWLRKMAIPATVTRVVVVKDSRVVVESFADMWRPFLQDEKRTLKLFALGSGADALAERDTALGGELVALTRPQYCNRCGGAFVGHHDCGRGKA